MKRKEFRGVIGIAALLYLVFTQMAYGQETKGDFTVSGGTSSFADNVLTVSGGEVTVSTNGETSQTILLTGGKLTLAGVRITVNNGAISPIEVENTVEINLASGSENTLKAGTRDAAGIHVPEGSQITFTGSGNLTASGNSSCAIGGKLGSYSCGTIIFDLDGSVFAKGGVRAAAIGTCMRGSQNNQVNGAILIRKGTIDATGGLYAAGIGSGPDGSSDGGVTVTIEGGMVKATGGEYSYGIGSGLNCKTPVDIRLMGGTVTADVCPGEQVSLNTLIVGPDVTITEGKTVSDNYTNLSDTQRRL